jgi:carbon monoxide dehydrogenase subunit G
MHRFSATTASQAVVAADRADIWAVLVDPEMLVKLTPLLRSIETDGDTWRWSMVKISALGLSIDPTFTERMRFEEGRRIDYSHEPPPGSLERLGADGCYVLSDVDGGTHLEISLTLQVELPLARLARPAVNRVISGLVRRTGDKFSANLLRHLREQGLSRPGA